MDCIQEDTNLIVNKPCYCNPEVKNRDLADVSTECWSIYLARNWSLFSFIFTGQTLSTLKCKNCQEISWTFEPFMTISLPMETSPATPLNITLIPFSEKLHSTIEGMSNENSAPKIISIICEKTTTVKDAVLEIYKMANTGICKKNQYTTIEICRVTNHRVVQIFHPLAKLSLVEQYSYINEIWAYEMLTEQGEMFIRNKEEPRDCLPDYNQKVIPEKYSLFMEFPFSTAGALAFQLQTPSEYFIHVINRCIINNPRFIWKKYEPKICGHPIILRAFEGETYYQLYEQAWEASSINLKANSPFASPENLWWHNKIITQNKRPFVLRIVNSNGTKCARCPWKEQCLGCQIEPTNEKLKPFSEIYIAIDWYLDVYNESYMLHTDKELHQSVLEIKKEMNKHVDIYDLIKKFISPEELDKAECTKCKKMSQSIKRLSLFRLPAIFIIHLKRNYDK